MSHIALYRKWRPQVFEHLVGQDHISKTLLNAINTNKVTHAYLFCGPRGTGKTTTARILAKALNCDSRVHGSPCNKCQSCLDLSNGTSLDVIEIDAASNRGISEIRALIEQVRFASVLGKYKVYIIDEFHMLTTEAFNAILKTLEEPPDKVVFVLATTEPHKILPTITSRCQRFDFSRISISALVDRLKYISEQENIKISDESLLSIARKANGGLRDAISLLDQISSFSEAGKGISTELVFQVLGLISTDSLTKLAHSIAKNEPVEIIKVLSELLKLGNDPVVITTETIYFFRNMLIVKSSPETAERLEVPVTILDDLKKVSQLFSVSDILNCLEFLNETVERIKRTTQAQLWLEINFVQLCKKEKVQENKELLERILKLETIISKIQDGKVIIPQAQHQHMTVLPHERQSVNVNAIDDYKEAEPKKQEIIKKQEIQENNQKNNSDDTNQDLSVIWDKILKETKKMSVPAEAMLSNGILSEINEKDSYILIEFEKDFFIEKLNEGRQKKSIFVERAVNSILGKPYTLRMKKNEIVREKKNEIKRDYDLKNYNIININDRFRVRETKTDESLNDILEKEFDKAIDEEKEEIEKLDKIDKIEVPAIEIVEAKINKDEETLVLKEISEEYKKDEGFIIPKKKEKTYFEEVADVFNGKIIDQTKFK